MKSRCLALMLLLAGTAWTSAQDDRPSHKLVNPELAEGANPEALLDARLKARKGDKLDPQLVDLAKQLMKDPELLQSLAKNKEVSRLKEKLEKGQGLEEFNLDKKTIEGLKGLFREGIESGKISPEQEKQIREWGEKVGPLEGGKLPGKNSSPPMKMPGGKMPKGPPPPPTGTPVQPKTPAATPKSGWGEIDKETTDWLARNLNKSITNLDKWVDSPSGKSWRDALRDVGGRLAEARNATPPVAGRLRGLTRHLPDVRGWLPRRSILPGARLPSVPRLGGRLPGVPSLPSVSPAGLGRMVLVVGVMVVLALLIWQSRGWWRDTLEARLAAWRLGPWPVRPGDVTTRADLVRAFEYLALLLLGPGARTCHHLELAQRMGQRPALDADRQREAAQDLARVYEQARYTPADEPLPDEVLTRARRELCYLAGEPAA